MLSDNRPPKPKCDKITFIISSVVFLLLTLIFFIIILVNHGMATDEISFYFHTTKTHIEEVVIGGEKPVWICVFACLTYCVTSLTALKESLTEKSILVTRIADSIYFPLLLAALVLLTDLLHIIFMVCFYICFSIAVADYSYRKEGNKFPIFWITVISGLTFWTGYFVGMGFNWANERPGAGVAQFSVLGIMIYDAYRVYNEGPVEYFDLSLMSTLRFILLMCVFIQEAR